MKVHLTLKSSNAKVGPIPVSTTGAETCPSVCPLKGNGCYPEYGPLSLHWRAVTRGERGMAWGEFCASIAALPAWQMWRHNQAGDLPGLGNRIDGRQMKALVDANRGRKGFTYTHKPLTRANAALIAEANGSGFTVNLSGNNLAHADELASAKVGPVTSVVPMDTADKFVTPGGRRGIVCPEQTGRVANCAACGLCAIASREVIIGFRAHGTGAKRANAVANVGGVK